MKKLSLLTILFFTTINTGQSHSIQQQEEGSKGVLALSIWANLKQEASINTVKICEGPLQKKDLDFLNNSISELQKYEPDTSLQFHYLYKAHSKTRAPSLETGPTIKVMDTQYFKELLLEDLKTFICCLPGQTPLVKSLLIKIQICNSTTPKITSKASWQNILQQEGL